MTALDPGLVNRCNCHSCRYLVPQLERDLSRAQLLNAQLEERMPVLESHCESVLQAARDLINLLAFEPDLDTASLDALSMLRVEMGMSP